MTIGMVVELMTGRAVSSGSFLNTAKVDEVFRLDQPGAKDVIPELQKVEYSEKKNTFDGTPFRKEFRVEQVVEELKRLGYNEFAYERMINGMTGEEMDSLIFTGISYYQRLKHMVYDKVHARNIGGVTALERQPRAGKKYEGGLRIGYPRGGFSLSRV